MNIFMLFVTKHKNVVSFVLIGFIIDFFWGCVGEIKETELKELTSGYIG